MMHSDVSICAPFLKWAGGKRQLLSQMSPFFPPNESYGTYFEPFLGAGAVLFHLRPERAFVSDTNSELINLYEVIRDFPDELIAETEQHSISREYYYTMRDLDRDSAVFATLSPVARASRLLYLNRLCYNGLFRVNSRGEFNVPYGSYKNPRIIDPELIHTVSHYFNTATVGLSLMDFEAACECAGAGDFVYFDPPYHPLSYTSAFTSYAAGGFSTEDQTRLAALFSELDKRGCQLMLSNSDTDFIRKLYKDFNINTLQASRSINSAGSGRGKVSEVLVTNY
jgi:DNA adenine methylase